MKIGKILFVDDVEALATVTGRSVIEHDMYKLEDDVISLCFERLSEGIDKFELKELGMEAADFMLMRFYFNGYSNVVAFKHRGTRNYVYWLDATGVLIIPEISDVSFLHGEFFLYLEVAV